MKFEVLDQVVCKDPRGMSLLLQDNVVYTVFHIDSIFLELQHLGPRPKDEDPIRLYVSRFERAKKILDKYGNPWLELSDFNIKRDGQILYTMDKDKLEPTPFVYRPNYTDHMGIVMYPWVEFRSGLITSLSGEPENCSVLNCIKPFFVKGVPYKKWPA